MQFAWVFVSSLLFWVYVCFLNLGVDLASSLSLCICGFVALVLDIAFIISLLVLCGDSCVFLGCFVDLGGLWIVFGLFSMLLLFVNVFVVPTCLLFSDIWCVICFIGLFLGWGCIVTTFPCKLFSLNG